MIKNNNELEKIINEIDRINLTPPSDIGELNYAELLYLHFVLETHESYGKVKLTEDKFPHEFDTTIIGGLIRKNFLIDFRIQTARLGSFIKENSVSFNKVQKEYFDLLSSHFPSDCI